MNEIKFFTAVYLPAITFIIVIIAVIQVKKNANQKIGINVFGLFDIPLPIKNRLQKIIFLIAGAVIIALYYTCLDFSKFFPSNFKMTVLFDEHGINSLLDELELIELNGLKIDYDYTAKRVKYFTDADIIINNNLGFKDYHNFAAAKNDFVLETIGETTLVLKKISGIQNYQITEGTGKLTHKKYLKNSSKTEIYASKFNKIISANDKVLIKTKSLFKKIVISPEFSQHLIINGKEEAIFDHSLFAVTALYPLPFPAYSNTLYLYQYENTFIPVGYAVYYSEQAKE